MEIRVTKQATQGRSRVKVPSELFDIGKCLSETLQKNVFFSFLRAGGFDE